MTMNFFGKLKNLHSGPPAPPKRIDNNAGYGWPEDEFDEEYGGDTYEAPPCEPDVKMPARQVEENVYLETRTSNPVVPGRQAAPPPRPAKVTPMGKVSKQPSQHDSEEFYIDPSPSFKKPPEVDRKEKPGKKSAPRRMPPSVRSPTLPAPTPAAAPQAEEDVYLDPNEGEGENDDLYLEPTAACPPVMRAPMRMPPPSKTASVSSLVPLMKPPVPRAKSSSSFNEVKAVPPLDVRRSTFHSFPSKLPPPTPGAKPPIPSSLKEAKPSPPPPPIEVKPAVSPTGMKASKQSGNEDREWFARDCDRKTAEDLLLRVNKDGAFLIRHSSAQNKAQAARQPYTLAVLYRQKVYNIPIRFLVETQGYALGKEGKKNEEIFSSLHEIISHHNSNQLLLIDSKSQAKYTTYLTHPARP